VLGDVSKRQRADLHRVKMHLVLVVFVVCPYQTPSNIFY